MKIALRSRRPNLGYLRLAGTDDRLALAGCLVRSQCYERPAECPGLCGGEGRGERGGGGRARFGAVFFSPLFIIALKLEPSVAIVTFTIPGVVVGGQIGPFLQTKLDPSHVKLGLSVVFTGVGLFMLSTLG